MTSATSPRARKRAAKWRLAQIIKLHTGCIDCGYAEHAVALQFDHLGDKRMNVSDMIRSDYGWETIKLEIAKCEVRCANCHAIKTRDRKRDRLEEGVLPESRQYSPLAPVHQSLRAESDSPVGAASSDDAVPQFPSLIGLFHRWRS